LTSRGIFKSQILFTTGKLTSQKFFFPPLIVVRFQKIYLEKKINKFSYNSLADNLQEGYEKGSFGA
jgi:hypothetical protein